MFISPYLNKITLTSHNGGETISVIPTGQGALLAQHSGICLHEYSTSTTVQWTNNPKHYQQFSSIQAALKFGEDYLTDFDTAPTASEVLIWLQQTRRDWSDDGESSPAIDEIETIYLNILNDFWPQAAHRWTKLETYHRERFPKKLQYYLSTHLRNANK